MSIDSGGSLLKTLKEESLDNKMKEENKIEDELEDGELDSEDDEPIKESKSKTNTQTKSTSSTATTNTTKSQSNQTKDEKPNNNSNNKLTNQKSSTTSSSNTSSTNKQQQQQQQINRKRRRRSGSEDSEESVDSKRKRSNASSNTHFNNRNNNNKSNQSHQLNRNKRSQSTDEELDSEEDDSYPKIDQKMMFTMLKQMQEFLMNNDNKSNKQSRQEYDKFFEKVKNNKGGHKEMLKFFKKNEKMMMNYSSQDNQHPLFNHFNNQPNGLLFPPNNGPPMFNHHQGPPMGHLGGPPFPPNNHPMNHPMNHQMNHPMNQGPMPPFNNNFNQGGLLPPPNHPNSHIAHQQLQAAAQLNELASSRNQHVLAPQSSLTSTSSNTKNKRNKDKRNNKKQQKGDDKDDHYQMMNDDQQQQQQQQQQPVNKHLCKYYLEGHCQKGDNCDFIHQQPYNYKREVCKFYLQDSCGKGDSCTFLHKEFPCKFFHTGQDCLMGENCKFSHEPINDELKEIFINYLDNAELNEELNVAYGLSKNQQKKPPPLLCNIPEEIKNSYQTWLWQKEMKDLEIAYTGTKRNLFCIDDEFLLKEEPERDGYEDDLIKNEFNDIDERLQPSFYFDKHGNEVNDDEEDDEMQIDDEKEINKFTKDNDLRKELNQKNELKSLDEVRKEWLKEHENEDDELEKNNNMNKEENKEEDKQNSNAIDITKMLDAIRQTTTQNNQQKPKPTTSSTDNKESNQEFWRSILNGVNLNDSYNKSSESESSFNQSSTTTSSSINQQQQQQQQSQTNTPTTAIPNKPRDPRLAKQRSHQVTNNQKQTKQQFTTSQSSLINYKIPSDEPFSWSIGDITFKLYKVDIDKIDYSNYKTYYDLDNKLRQDPRLQNYFSNNYSNQQQPSQQQQSSTLSSSSSSSITNSNLLPSLLSPTDVLPPLTLSSSYSKKIEPTIPNLLITPPVPTSNLSSLDIISPSTTSKSTMQTNSQLSFQEQILASVSVPKKEMTIPESGGLTSLADLVTEKSKKVNS